MVALSLDFSLKKKLQILALNGKGRTLHTEEKIAQVHDPYHKT